MESSYKNIELHNSENKNNRRWLMVVNSIEGDTSHRDFHYSRFRISHLWNILMFKIFWGSFGESLFIQTYDMQNLKKWETGKLTKELIDSGYFTEIRHSQGQGIRF